MITSGEAREAVYCHEMYLSLYDGHKAETWRTSDCDDIFIGAFAIETINAWTTHHRTCRYALRGIRYQYYVPSRSP